MAYIAARGVAGGFRARCRRLRWASRRAVSFHTAGCGCGAFGVARDVRDGFSIVKWWAAAFLLYTGVRLLMSSLSRQARATQRLRQGPCSPRRAPEDLSRGSPHQRAQSEGRAVLLASCPVHRGGRAKPALHRFPRDAVQREQPVREPAGACWLRGPGGGADAASRLHVCFTALSAHCACCLPRECRVERTSARRQMATLESKLKSARSRFAMNRDAMLAQSRSSRQGCNDRGGRRDAAAREHLDRGKLLPRERIRRGATPASRSSSSRKSRVRHVRRQYRGGRDHYRHRPRIGCECVIVCNDATVKGGTYYR